MPFKKIVVLFVFAQLLLSCLEMRVPNKDVQIIPIPQSKVVNNGLFTLDSTTGISFPAELKISGEFLKAYIEQGSAIKLQEANTIEFILDKTITTKEAYHLDIQPDKIEIKAASDHGAFYAVQTLRQLLPPAFENGTYTNKKIAIPCVTIKDQPQFQYRGMHLDVGRHMYSVDFIKTYIDAMAMIKMNTFHWHLTEDQGWRIEIKKYPKLQGIAAYRNETLIGHYNDQPHQFDGKRYGGYYTQEEIKDIVAYAQKRHITIIPEIEMPGHSQAAIAAYPELGCTGEKIEVATKWGVFEDIYCPKEETFTFLENVLDEVLELFPSKYIHIGGDEAPKTQWKQSQFCQNLMKEKGLKDENELQSYFISRIEKYLNSKGRQIIGWDEILEGGLAPNATVMSWRGTSGAIAAAQQHHNVIITPTSHCYFDYYQSESDNEPLAIGGFIPLEKVYHFNPIPEALTREESKYVLGAQGNLWTEYMPTEDKVEYMVFPRILAMSEVLWSAPEQKNYPHFVSRLEHFHKRLDALDINYANHLYEIEGDVVSNDNGTYYQLSTATKGKTIRYTLDGSKPTINSKVFKTQIPITKTETIKAAVFGNDKILGKTFKQSINYHKAVGAKITIDKTPHKTYPGSGAQGLINGISGSDTRYGDKEWLGFWGEDIEITIDLRKETHIKSIKTRFHNGNGQWIYAPKAMKIELDHSFFEYPTQNTDHIISNQNIGINQNSRFIKIKIPNYGIIPEGKQGAGHNAWTFIDEIIIN